MTCLHAVLWLLWCILLEFELDRCSRMKDYDVLEYNIVDNFVMLKFDLDHRPLVANDVHMLIFVTLLNDESGLGDWLRDGVDTFG